MPARLLYRDAQGRDAFVDVHESTPVFLGRGTDCAVRTEDAMVSRKNCKIAFTGAYFFAEDLGSANGTYVNEQRIQKQALNHADVIRCGSLQVRFVEVSAAAQPGQRPSTEENQDLGQGAQAQIQQAGEERDFARKQLDDLKNEVETLRAKVEAAESELKRLRGDAVGSRDELAKVRRDAAQDKDELHAVTRVAEELKRSLTASKEEGASLRKQVEEQGEELAARDRQLERAQEDVQRTKQTMEELRNKLAELQKTKDEGWKELNAQLSQVEHLREVIAEQERILEERRVGLISLEGAAKDVRAEKEKLLRELVDTRNVRDDLKDKLVRAEAKVEGLEEEHRRLARAMNEGGGQSGDELSRMAEELRNLKVDFRKVESERQRALDNFERVDEERKTLMDARAKHEVERAQLAEDKKVAEAARARSEDARAKAESTRQRADEEKQQASAARDTALQSLDELKRSLERAEKQQAEAQRATGDAVDLQRALERAQRRIEELEAEGAATGGAPEGSSTSRDLELDARAARAEVERAEAVAAQRQAEEQAVELGNRVRLLEDERGRLQEALADVQAGAALGDSTSRMAAVAAGGEDGIGELRQRAQDAYDGINGALSELRTTIITAQGLFAEVGSRISNEEAGKALGDALADSVERTEDAKGLLRSLKELAEG